METRGRCFKAIQMCITLAWLCHVCSASTITNSAYEVFVRSENGSVEQLARRVEETHASGVSVIIDEDFSVNYGGNTGFYSVLTSGRSEYGSLHVYSRLDLDDSLPGTWSAVGSGASALDRVWFSGGLGTGIASFSYSISGSALASSEVWAGIHIGIAAYLSSGTSLASFSSSIDSGGSRVPPMITIDVPVTFGIPFFLSTTMGTELQVFQPQTVADYFLEADAWTSLTLTGIHLTAMSTPPQGSPVLLGDSGYSYPAPTVAAVPEPGAGLLVAAGVFILAVLPKTRGWWSVAPSKNAYARGGRSVADWRWEA